MKFDTTVIDPWNDLSMNLNSQGGREDLFLADALKHVRDQSRQRHRTDIIITHISAPYAKHRSQKGVRFASPAEPYEIAGGQTWYRRAFTMILVYRPPSPDQLKFGKVLIDTNAGETWLVIQKSKPKGVGKLGRVIQKGGFSLRLCGCVGRKRHTHNYTHSNRKMDNKRGQHGAWWVSVPNWRVCTKPMGAIEKKV